MVVLYQERKRGSGVYFERSMLDRDERVGRVWACWVEGKWICAVRRILRKGNK